MTPELFAQRRWECVAVYVEKLTRGGVVPTLMPLTEGGGILLITATTGRALHFWNYKAMVNVDISDADTGFIFEGRRNCFRFDQPLSRTAEQVVVEMSMEEE
jgi:hypothetical protein